MSFLNSVLSSIGGDGPRIHTPPPQPTTPMRTTVDQAKDRRNIDLPSTTTGITLATKRKAEQSPEAPRTKTRIADTPNGQSPHAASSLKTRPSTLAPTPRPSQPTAASGVMPYRGTGKVDAASKSLQTPAMPAEDAGKAPKKGSYAEIMARAKATQSKPPAVGVISHKAKEKGAVSYKKELKMKAKLLKNKKLGIKEEQRPNSSGSMSSSPAPGKPEMKKGTQPGYKGTGISKPQPSYKGTMKAGTSIDSKPKSRDRAGTSSKVRYDEYAATDEDDLDDVEEDDYGSEESDDMEAGFSDVEQEESSAAVAARKEDEEEARLEAKLKKAKEDRRRTLEAMAKKAKPQRY